MRGGQTITQLPLRERRNKGLGWMNGNGDGEWGTKEWERRMGNEGWGMGNEVESGTKVGKRGRAAERKRRRDEKERKRRRDEESRRTIAHCVRCESLNAHDGVSTNHQPVTANYQPPAVQPLARQLQAPRPRDAKTLLRRLVTPGCTRHGEDGGQGVKLVETR